MYLKSILLIFIFLFPFNLINAQVIIEFEKGKVIPSVTCLEDKDESYALYLPKAYNPLKKWPIIIGFSPAARGTDPVTLCAEAAEKFGFIVIGSNNSRNGDSAPINKAYLALKKEIQKRFSYDPDRVYSIGMSGGSRVALRFAGQEKDMFRGVIACAAFINPAENYEGKDIFIYGIVGDEDFNYSEYKRGPLLDKTKTPYWIEIYQGKHQWPPKEKVYEAIEMFDYLYHKKSEGKGLAQAELIINNRIANTDKLISKKLWIHASAEVENLLRNFNDHPLAVKMKELRKKLDENVEYQADKKAETEFFESVEKVKQINDSPDYWKVFAKMQSIAKEKTRFGNLAKATLGSLSDSIKMSYKNISENKSYSPSLKGLFFNIAHQANPSDPRVPCISAFFYAQAQDKPLTLTMLSEAAKLGYSDTEAIAKAKEFEFLKDDPEYIKTIQKMTENKAAPKK